MNKNKKAIKAYAEAKRMQQEIKWNAKAKKCSNIYVLVLALVLGGLMLAIIFKAFF
jgi:hypothetical protein